MQRQSPHRSRVVHTVISTFIVPETINAGGDAGAPGALAWFHFYSPRRLTREAAHKISAAMRELGNWYSRGYLPHFDEGATEQLITYRLADALPHEVILKIEEQSRLGAPTSRRLPQRLHQDAIETWLNAGHGSCVLKTPSIARAVIDAWKYYDGKRYDLLAWTVMPNHVHVLIKTAAGEKLGKIVQLWKSYTARKILAAPDVAGCFPDRRIWQREYWDRFIRNEAHRTAAIRYIHENPVKAGLVQRAEDWPWSSAAGAPTSRSAL